jgi:hypothetical protein
MEEGGGCVVVALALAVIYGIIKLVVWLVGVLWAGLTWVSINALTLGDAAFGGFAAGGEPVVWWALWGLLIGGLGHFGAVEARRLNRPAVGPAVLCGLGLLLGLSLLVNRNSTEMNRAGFPPAYEAEIVRVAPPLAHQPTPTPPTRKMLRDILEAAPVQPPAATRWPMSRPAATPLPMSRPAATPLPMETPTTPTPEVAAVSRLASLLPGTWSQSSGLTEHVYRYSSNGTYTESFYDRTTGEPWVVKGKSWDHRGTWKAYADGVEMTDEEGKKRTMTVLAISQNQFHTSGGSTFERGERAKQTVPAIAEKLPSGIFRRRPGAEAGGSSPGETVRGPVVATPLPMAPPRGPGTKNYRATPTPQKSSGKRATPTSHKTYDPRYPKPGGPDPRYAPPGAPDQRYAPPGAPDARYL